MQGINRTLLSWMKLWDETVFGHSALSTASSMAGRPGRKKDDSRGRDIRPGSGSARGGGGSKRGRGGVDFGKKEWKELRDPATFASEEVSRV